MRLLLTPPAQSETQVPRSRKRHPALAQGVRHPARRQGRPRWLRAGRAGGCGRRIALTRELMDVMLTARAALWKEYLVLHDLVVKLVARDELCRRFMAIPGVGPVTALSFQHGDRRSRRASRRSRDVAAYFGLTSRRWQSGTSIDVQGRISKAGDPDVRRALYEAASRAVDALQGQGQRSRPGGCSWPSASATRKATVAVARKLAVIMHAMWRRWHLLLPAIRRRATTDVERAGRRQGHRSCSGLMHDHGSSESTSTTG